MPTSHKTREYWVDKAKGWAGNCLAHPGYGDSPQLDEFNAVMDELLELSSSLTQIVGATQPTSHEMTVTVKVANDDALTELIRERMDRLVPPEMRETIKAIPAPILEAVRDILATIPTESLPNEALDIIVAAMRDGRGAYQWYEVAKRYKEVLQWYGDPAHYDKNGALYSKRYPDVGQRARKVLEKKMSKQKNPACLSAAILQLAARLLEDASESYGSHGCNDFEMEDTPENIALVVEVAKENGWDLNPNELARTTRNGKKFVIAMDYELMAYCAKVLKGAANE